MSTKLKLQICYGFYREWVTAKDYMDIDEPNSFRYHLASNRAYQIREHLNRNFPQWMLDACAKMRSETYARYDWQVKESIEHYRQKMKRNKIAGLLPVNVPF